MNSSVSSSMILARRLLVQAFCWATGLESTRRWATARPSRPNSSPKKTGLNERYLREWLSGKAAAGYIDYNAEEKVQTHSGTSMRLRRRRRARVLRGAFEVANRCGSMSQGRRSFQVRQGRRLARAFAVPVPRHRALLPSRLQRQSGLELDSRARRRRGEAEERREGRRRRLRPRRLDDPDGAGLSRSRRFFGFDYHAPSIERAPGELAKEAGVANRITFAVASAKDFPAKDYDLVAFFDCLHDMGDPVGAGKHVKETLAKDGAWMIVEPFANDDLKDNLNPVGRVYYAASTMICTPASLSRRWRSGSAPRPAKRGCERW